MKAWTVHTSGPILVVALDPGKATGVAVRDMYADAWRVTTDARRTLHFVSSMPFWDVSAYLEALASIRKLDALVIEDTRLLPIYQERRGRLVGQALAKMARSVGRIDRDVTLWEDWAKLNDILVVMWPPFRGKWKAADFEAAVGNAHAHARTNQHGRDAARLVLAVSPGDLRIARTVAALPSP